MSHDRVTLTLRLIRSFTHRNIKYVVLHDVDLTQTAQNFLRNFLETLPNRSDIPLPFMKYSFDTMKIQHKAHGYKTNDPVINTEDDDKLMIDPDKTLLDNGIENETEISVFKLEDYKQYQLEPGRTAW